jgi:lysozyme family protein
MVNDDFQGKDIDRRSVIRLAAQASTGLMLSGSALAQTPKTIEIFGQEIPTEIAGLKLPSKPLSLVRAVTTILKLEKEADRRGLRASRLAFDGGTPLVPSEASFYQAAVPRLVTLIDRSEDSDPNVADQAGELLAEVNEKERVTPEALKPVPLVLSRAHSYAALKDEYAVLFQSAEVRAEHTDTIEWHKTMLTESRARYEAVANATQVPWQFIGLIHGLEASYNFRAHLHNGDFPLTKRTRQVPAGRPLVWLPPDDWASSAKDALRLMGYTGQTDWTTERMLYRLEAYNGFGYRKVGVPTPYLWSFSTHYERGKFVADGKWNPNARSHQCGAATILKGLALSSTLKLG